MDITDEIVAIVTPVVTAMEHATKGETSSPTLVEFIATPVVDVTLEVCATPEAQYIFTKPKSVSERISGMFTRKGGRKTKRRRIKKTRKQRRLRR